MAYGGKQQRGGSSLASGNPTYDYASSKISREQENRDALQQIEAEGREALADIDVWAAEEAYKAGQSAQDRTWSALGKLTDRSVGGGNFSSALSGRGTVNLGGLTGGLDAANLSRLKQSQVAAATSKYASDVALQNALNDSANQAEREKLLTELEYRYQNQYTREQLEQMLDGGFIDAGGAGAVSGRAYIDATGNIKKQYSTTQSNQRQTANKFQW